eukprot:364977-Chlamydomonas_euryale.AAC.4
MPPRTTLSSNPFPLAYATESCIVFQPLPDLVMPPRTTLFSNPFPACLCHREPHCFPTPPRLADAPESRFVVQPLPDFTDAADDCFLLCSGLPLVLLDAVWKAGTRLALDHAWPLVMLGPCSFSAVHSLGVRPHGLCVTPLPGSKCSLRRTRWVCAHTGCV